MDAVFLPSPSSGKLLLVSCEKTAKTDCSNSSAKGALQDNASLVHLACSLLSNCSAEPCIKEEVKVSFHSLPTWYS